MGRLKIRLYRILYIAIAKNLPLSNAKINFGAKKLRRFCTKGMVKYCGKDVNIEKGAIFSPLLSIDDFSGVGRNCELNGEITIGKNVLMGPEVVMYTQNHEFIKANELIRNQGYREKSKIIIEDDVWIGRRVIILPGVCVGRGAVIGAGAVVAKDIPEYSVVVGNPAKVIRMRERE